MSNRTYGATPAVPGGAVALSALFVAALVTAQVTAAKVLAFEIPVGLPVTGSTLVLPGAALAYALTFLASDCYAELYGKRAAQVLVNVGFLLNFLVLALVWSTIPATMFVEAPSTVSKAAGSTLLGAAGARMVLHTSASTRKFSRKPTLTSTCAARRPYSSA